MNVLMPVPVEQLTGSCFRITLDRDRSHDALERKAGDPAFSARSLGPREHLSSNVPVLFVRSDRTMVN